MESGTEESYYTISTATATPLLTKPKGAITIPNVFNSFRSDQSRGAAPQSAINLGQHGRSFNTKQAAFNTANAPLVRRLKGRHLQMIAIGGSIGQFPYDCMRLSCNSRRYWSIYWEWGSSRNWRTRISADSFPHHWSSLVLHHSGTWRDGRDISGRWFFLCFCHTIYRSCLGFCIRLELRYAMALRYATRNHGSFTHPGILANVYSRVG